MHFINNDNIGTYQGPYKLFKIYPVLSHLNTKFQSLYLPGQNIAIRKTFFQAVYSPKVFQIWNQVI
jgi:hypothetical protein